jgi:hypothetical protein
MRLDPATAVVYIPVLVCSMAGPNAARNRLAGGLRNWLAGGLVDFFVFLLINRGGHSKELASISQLMEAGKATASVDPPLTMTFDWRRLQCPPTLTLFARLH